jgi:hypothetical protein
MLKLHDKQDHNNVSHMSKYIYIIILNKSKKGRSTQTLQEIHYFIYSQQNFESGKPEKQKVQILILY